MSERAGKMLREDMSDMGPVRLRDVDEAQMHMVNIAKEMAADGEIMIASDKARTSWSTRPAENPMAQKAKFLFDYAFDERDGRRRRRARPPSRRSFRPSSTPPMRAAARPAWPRRPPASPSARPTPSAR